MSTNEHKNSILWIQNQPIEIDLAEGVDISIPYHNGINQVNCFYAPLFSFEPVRMGAFVGSVKEGGPVNYTNVKLNIHGNGTHTECVGHISEEWISINQRLMQPFLLSQLISLYPTKRENGDRVIERHTLEHLMDLPIIEEALIIRSLPNVEEKRFYKYSGTNPTYFSVEAMEFLVEAKIKHLLVDIPSVDREEDEGALAAHKKFWQGDRAKLCTITELIFVPDKIKDGKYVLFLQTAPMEMDAVPSRPVLFRILNETN
ncbi:MAG: cyclase family protein [Bacteroidota bacterium]|nr:cyclase family protein [Bacteroidota bacterium]